MSQEWALGAPADMESRLRRELADLADMSTARLTKVVKEEVARVGDSEDQFAALRIRGLASALKIGQALSLIKEDVGHGGFGQWLEANWTKSDRTARDYMKLARNFSDYGLQIGSAADLHEKIGTSVRWGLRLTAAPRNEETAAETSAAKPAPEPITVEARVVAVQSAPAPRPLPPAEPPPPQASCACGALLPPDAKLCEACVIKRSKAVAIEQEREDEKHGPITLGGPEEGEPVAEPEDSELAELWVRVKAYSVRVEGAMKAMASLNSDGVALLKDVRAAKATKSKMRVALGHVKPSTLLENADEEITTSNASVALSRAPLEKASAANKRLSDVLKRGGVA